MTNKNEQGMPKVQVSLPDWVEQIIDRALSKHIRCCPLVERVDENRDGIEGLRVRLASLIAFMVGSGLFGGVAVSVLNRLFGSM